MDGLTVSSSHAHKPQKTTTQTHPHAQYVLKDARGVIHFMLMASVAMQVVTAVLSMIAGQIWLFVMSLLFAMVTLCYYRVVRNRIPVRLFSPRLGFCVLARVGLNRSACCGWMWCID